MNPSPDPKAPSPFSPKLVLGVAIIVMGLLLTLDNLGLVEAHIFFRLWPLILVAVGVAKLRQEGSSGTGAWVLIFAGAFILLANFGHLHLTDTFGPLLIVALGIFLVTRALKQSRGVPPDLARSDDFLQGTAIFGGFKRRVLTQALRGGELTAIFGGFDVDLRHAALAENQARLDVFVLFGGGEVKVPEGWEIANRATSIMGSVGDSTYHGGEAREGRPRLVLTGLTLFGGVEVKS